MSAAADAVPPRDGDLPRAQVLIVDDTPEFLALLGELLSPHYAVRVARSGARALELALAQPPDLVLLDVMMPGMDGYGVLRALRDDARTAQVPVIFVTGLEGPADESRGFELGAADYIVKPYNADIVLARVRLHVELKRARDQLAAQNAALAEEVTRRTQVEAEVRSLNERLRARGDALERSVGDLGAFSYSVSHDLRAPLRAISGFSQLLLESEAERLTDEGKAMLGRIVAGVARMDRLIADVLQYSRIEQADLKLAEVDLGAIAAAVVAELRGDYPSTTIDVGPLPTLTADPVMVRQIFTNLIGNALKFSKKASSPRVEIGMEEGASAPTIFIRDNGVGFETRYVNRLFGLFQRLHSESQFPGTGLGLAIVKRLVQRQGGVVSADSVPGVRTVFRFTLEPVAAAAREAGAPPAPA